MKNKRQEEKAEMFTGISFKWRDFRLQDIIENDEHGDPIKENLGLKNGTKVLYINNKNKLVPAKIKDEVGYNQYQIQDDKEGDTEVLYKGKKAKQGKYFQVNEYRYEGKVNEDSYHSGAIDDFIKKNESDAYGYPTLKVFGEKGDTKHLSVSYDALRQIAKILKTMKLK
jgi:hypothetical protein